MPWKNTFALNRKYETTNLARLLRKRELGRKNCSTWFGMNGLHSFDWFLKNPGNFHAQIFSAKAFFKRWLHWYKGLKLCLTMKLWHPGTNLPLQIEPNALVGWYFRAVLAFGRHQLVFDLVIPKCSELVVQGQLGGLGAPRVLLTSSGFDSLEDCFAPAKEWDSWLQLHGPISSERYWLGGNQSEVKSTEDKLL